MSLIKFDITFAGVLAALQANDNQVVRNNILDNPTIHAIAQYGDYTVALMSMEETPYFSVNQLYVDSDGKPHIERGSVGVTIFSRQAGSLEAAIAVHNDPTKWASWYQLTQITNVTYL